MTSAAILWTEKYRPKSVSSMFGNEHITKALKRYVKTRKIPNLLMVGPPGTGKTSSANALAHDLFGDEAEVKELNASDDRGISVVRGFIKNYARTMPISNVTYKILILDECDNMTKEAQEALRRLIEESSDICRFIFIANDDSHIIDAIKSRCATLRFEPISDENVTTILEMISSGEGIDISNDAISIIVAKCNGDLRAGINILQALAEGGKLIAKEDVQGFLQTVPKGTIDNIIYLATTKKFAESVKAYKSVFHGLFASKEFSDALVDGLIKGKYPSSIAKHLTALRLTGIPSFDQLQILAFLAEIGE